MVMKENSEIVFEEEPEDDSKRILEESSNVEYLVEGELPVVKRALTSQVQEDNLRRENIFLTLCFVNGKVYNISIYEGSYTNVVSMTMVEKLRLSTEKHLNPYKLQWLSNDGEIRCRGKY